jgi:lipoprotein-anchoring transpeptidase ErfK/SrfK
VGPAEVPAHKPVGLLSHGDDGELASAVKAWSAPPASDPAKRAERLGARMRIPATTPVVVTSWSAVNVRSGPSIGYSRVGLLAPRAWAPVTGHHGGWWQIDYRGQLGWVSGEVVVAYHVDGVPEVQPPAPAPPPTPVPGVVSEIGVGRWIDVDLSEQRLTAYEDDVPVRWVTVSTGLPATPTPEGQFRIYVKFVADDMEGPGYYLQDVPYAMYFYLGYGVHGTYWHDNFGQPMSHGCVNLPTSEAEWLFNWASVGTLVNIHP